MNGILNPMPPGILSDPRQAAMLQAGLGLLQASGPSKMPVGLGQAIGQAGMQGVNAFQQIQQAQLQEEMRKRQIAIQEEQLKLQQQRANRPQAPTIAGPGSAIIGPNGEIVRQVPFKPDAPEKPQPPMTRTFLRGDQKVTQEYVNGEWRELGSGPAFQPTKPTPAPKAPHGFRWKEGMEGQEMEPVPGGPKDTSPKDSARAAGAIQKADTVIRKVDEAMNQVGFSSTGLTGTVLGMVPGTKAYDLDKTVDTIKANLGFSELQAMREASPTGGALGQVAIQELAMLQSTVASLDKGQSEENLKRALAQVRQHFQNWKNAVQQAQQAAPTAAPAAPQAPQAPKRRVYNPKSGKFE
jgi:hypothetical protein